MQSLQVVHQIVETSPKVRIFLVHLLKMPTDILDLLFVKKYQLYQHVPDKFNQAVEMLKNKYPAQIEWMGREFYYGSNVSTINGILESRNIDEVCQLENYPYTLPLQASVDMLPLLRRSKAQITCLPLRGKVTFLGEGNYLSALFTDAGQTPVTTQLAKQD